MVTLPAAHAEPAPAQDSETLRLLLARIAELEREAGRLEARVRQAHLHPEDEDP